MKIKEWLIIASVGLGFYAFLYFNMFIFLCFIVTSIAVLILSSAYIKQSFILLYDPIFLLLLFLSLFSTPFVFLNKYSIVFYYPLTILSMLLAVVYSQKEGRVSFYRGVRLLLCAYILQILLHIYSSNGFTRLSFPLDNMIDGFSSNGVTSFLIVVASIYTLLRFNLLGKGSLFVSFITLYICIIGYGRGSIISALVLLIINVLFLTLKRAGHSLVIVVRFFIILIVAFAVIFNFEIVFSLFQENTKLAAGFDDVRLSMLEEYLGVMNTYSVLFGASYENTSIATLYNGNPHNSFIRAHHTMGLFYVLFIGYLLIKVSYFALRKNSLVSLLSWLILINLILRSYTEPILFPTVFDSFFFAGVLLLSRTEAALEYNKV